MITPAADTILPTTFTWRLGGDPGPSLLKAFPLGDAVRNAVMRAGNAVGLARLPEAFHGGPGVASIAMPTGFPRTVTETASSIT